MIWIAAAVFWGVAEASFFFIVPDVLLTAVVLRAGWREALKLAVIVALAASAAGALMWSWGAIDAAGARRAMLMVPAIGPDLLARAGREMDAWWGLHMIAGAVTGVPYKLYAVAAGGRHIALVPFLLASFAARLARFSYSVGLTAVVAHGLDRLDRPQWKAPLLALGWIGLYAVYFSIRATASAAGG